MVALDDLDRVVRVGLLYDHYGALLTEHQREAIDLYYLRNWSLQEIADSWATSRQAVHDLIGRAVRQLEEYDVKLGLLAREHKERETWRQVAVLLDKARSAADSETVHQFLEKAGNAVRAMLGADDENE